MATSDQWRWTDGQGVQRLLDVDELRAALADGRLQPTVLVWQRGMSSWVPAQEVPRLMEGLEMDEPTTDESLTAPHEVGRRAEPTPSIPPAMGADRGRFEQRAGSTMMGIGSGISTPEPTIPKAARTPKPDGGWKDGAARRDDDEKTVTKVAKKAKHPADRRIGPKAKTLPYSVTKEMGLGSGPKGPPPPAPGPARSGTTKIPPAVGSKEVLSDKFSGPDESEAAPAPTKASSSDRGLRGRVGGKRGSSPGRTRAKTAKLEELDGAAGAAGKKPVLANAFAGVELGKGTPSPSPTVADEASSGWTKPPPKRKKVLPKPAPKRSVPPPAPKRSPVKRSVPPPGGKKRSLPPPPKRSIPPAAKASVPPAAKASVPPPAKASVPPPAKRSVAPPATKSASPGSSEDEGTSLPPPPALPALDDGAPVSEEVLASSASVSNDASAQSEASAPSETEPGAPGADAVQDAIVAPLAEPVSVPPAEPVAAPFPSSTRPPSGDGAGLAASAGLAEPLIGHAPDARPSVEEPRSGPLSLRTVRKASKDPRVLTGVAAAAAVLGLLAFLIGRATASSNEVIASVKSGLDAVPIYTRGATTDVKPSACLMLRAPARLAPEANHRVPFETRAIGEALYVGFARSESLPGGLEVNPTIGTGELVFAPEEERDDRLSRVVPLAPDRFGETFANDGGLREGTYVASEPPFVVAMKGDTFVRRPDDGELQTLWSLPGAAAGDAISAVHQSGKGTVLAYRYGDQVFLGSLDASGAVAVAAEAVAGSGGKVGKPNVATDGRDVSVVFADKPTAPGSNIEIRWGHAPWGESITGAAPVELPPGGPGGDAIAPAIASLPGRRWLLMWTEGKVGDRTLRAQTYDKNRRPVGAALRVSPATGSFGAGTIAVVDQSAVVLFLLATRNGYEVWGTVLQCH